MTITDKILLFCIGVFLSGCAANPKNIAPSDVSYVSYLNLDCEQLAAEQRRLITSLFSTSLVQQQVRGNDFASVIFTGVPVAWIDGTDKKSIIAGLKGELLAVQKAIIEEKCDTKIIPVDQVMEKSIRPSGIYIGRPPDPECPPEWCANSSSGSLASGKTRFTVSADGVIEDALTGLEWVTGPDQDTDYTQAEQWVAGNKAAGGGWRMPTRKELQTLYQANIGGRNMDPVFKTSGWYVWAEPRDASSAWVFNIDGGKEEVGGPGFFRRKPGGRVFGVRPR